jgi:hypothetical protein
MTAAKGAALPFFSILKEETDLAAAGSVFALRPGERLKELSLQIVSFILL